MNFSPDNQNFSKVNTSNSVTVKTQIRLLVNEQSDHGLPGLLF